MTKLFTVVFALVLVLIAVGVADAQQFRRYGVSIYENPAGSASSIQAQIGQTSMLALIAFYDAVRDGGPGGSIAVPNCISDGWCAAPAVFTASLEADGYHLAFDFLGHPGWPLASGSKSVVTADLGPLVAMLEHMSEPWPAGSVHNYHNTTLDQSRYFKFIVGAFWSYWD